MYVVVSFRTLRVQTKMYMATQLDINPSTNTILNVHPYKVYLNESSKQLELLLLTIIKARPLYSDKVLWAAAVFLVFRSRPLYNFQRICKFLRSLDGFVNLSSKLFKGNMKFVAVEFPWTSSSRKIFSFPTFQKNS